MIGPTKNSVPAPGNAPASSTPANVPVVMQMGDQVVFLYPLLGNRHHVRLRPIEKDVVPFRFRLPLLLLSSTQVHDARLRIASRQRMAVAASKLIASAPVIINAWPLAALRSMVSPSPNVVSSNPARNEATRIR